jgi:hypothetical protein
VQAQRYARKAMKDSASSEHVNPRVWKMFSEASAYEGKAWPMVMRGGDLSTAFWHPLAFAPAQAIDFKTNTLAPFQSRMADLELGTVGEWGSAWPGVCCALHIMTITNARHADFLQHILPLLHAPLPRVWTSVSGGLAEPMRATTSHGHPHITGACTPTPQHLHAMWQPAFVTNS